jgi:hypothetical protein
MLRNYCRVQVHKNIEFVRFYVYSNNLYFVDKKTVRGPLYLLNQISDYV